MSIDTEHHVRELNDQGYTVVSQAIAPHELAPMREAWDRLMNESVAANPDEIHVQIKRCLEQDPVFEPLMNWPTTFPIVHNVLGHDVTLLSSGEGDYRAPHTKAFISWHNDFAFLENLPYPRQVFLVRCTYFIDDVTPDMGPFTLLPGSHKFDHGPPDDMTDADGAAILPAEAVGVTGKAGDCLLNITEIWHTHTPNRSDRARKPLVICYKHAWMQPWGDGGNVTDAFAERQTDPVRRQLCGLVAWHSRFKDVGDWKQLETG